MSSDRQTAAVDQFDERYYYSVRVEPYDGRADAEYVAGVDQCTRGSHGLFADTRKELVDAIVARLKRYEKDTVATADTGAQRIGPVPVSIETVAVEDETDFEITAVDLVDDQAALTEFSTHQTAEP